MIIEAYDDESGETVNVNVTPEFVENADSFVSRLISNAADAVGGKPGAREFFSTREDIGPYKKSQLVRVDKVAMALHLMAARFALRNQPSALVYIQEAILNFLGRQAAVQAEHIIVKRLGWRAIPGISWIALLIAEFRGVVDDHAVQNGLELGIRGISGVMRKDLVKSSLPVDRQGEVRKTKEVYTRHRTPLQRKENKSWRSPSHRS